MSQSSVLSSAAFRNLVGSLKRAKKTCCVVEQCCGGLINASILSQPGASAVYVGGSVVYNTAAGRHLLPDDDGLHRRLSRPRSSFDGGDDAARYVASKLDWTAAASAAYCESLGVDYCLAEGGAAGPTFNTDGVSAGFAAIAVAGRGADGSVQVLGQTVVRSEHARREDNMRLFADAVAELAVDVIHEGADRTPTKEEDVGAPAIGAPAIEAPAIGAPAIVTPLNRATELRSQPETLAAMERHARFVVLRGTQVLMKAGSTTEPHFLTYDEVDALHGAPREGVTSFLGIDSDRAGTPFFGLDLPPHTDHPEPLPFADTRTSAPLFSPADNARVLHATALAQWQRRSSFCAACGAPADLVDGGTARRCSSCGVPSWPRQDPSIIAAVSSRCGEKILLANSPRHPPGLHTVLAGFVEVGETYEAAVAREAFEETGVVVDEGSPTYIGSQPWPFPQSSMIGFTATADHTSPLVLQEEEILAAQWFDRGQVERAAAVKGATMQPEVVKKALEDDPQLELLIPPKGVIARMLIDTWLDRKQ